jgi:hypothetical protein
MPTIQSSIALYSVAETVLRQALQENRPRTFREIFSNVEVQRVATGEQQMRDVLSSFRRKGMVVKSLMAPYGDKYNKKEVGWMWNPEEHWKIPSNDKKPSHVTVVKNPITATTTNNEVELVIGSATIVIGRNPITNRIRITIEG